MHFSRVGGRIEQGDGKCFAVWELCRGEKRIERAMRDAGWGFAM